LSVWLPAIVVNSNISDMQTQYIQSTPVYLFIFTFQGVRKTPTLASAETLYGGDSGVSPPPPPTRSTESLYGFLPQAGDALLYGGPFSGSEHGEVADRRLQEVADRRLQEVAGRRLQGCLAAPALQYPPRNTLERRKIHFNPFEEYSD
jgi:hypothetical protein